MPVSDLSRNSYARWRLSPRGCRPAPGSSYPVGTLVIIADMSKQRYKDLATVVPSAASVTSKPIMGVVAEQFRGSPIPPGVSPNFGVNQGGFDGAGLIIEPAAGALGTDKIDVTYMGMHGLVQVDQTSGAAAITNGVSLVPSANAAGKAMGLAAPVLGSFLGSAVLNAAAPFNTLGTGAVTQASQTITITGTPVVNEVYTIQFQVPFVEVSGGSGAYGIAQYGTLTLTLTAAQAVSATTAAAAVVAALTANLYLSNWYSATNSSGVITVTVVSNPFLVTIAGPDGVNYGARFYLTTNGTVGNSLTLGTMTVSSTSILTASGSNSAFTGYPTTSPVFSSGAGYVGTVPALIGNG